MAKIVVVDDAQETVDFISGVLREAGHQVVAFKDGTDLESQIAQHVPDLLLLDVVMPERNGYQILRNLKRGESTKTLPVILVSSKSEPTDVEWGKLQGADDYLTKPFTPAQLLSHVSRFA